MSAASLDRWRRAPRLCIAVALIMATSSSCYRSKYVIGQPDVPALLAQCPSDPVVQTNDGKQRKLRDGKAVQFVRVSGLKTKWVDPCTDVTVNADAVSVRYRNGQEELVPNTELMTMKVRYNAGKGGGIVAAIIVTLVSVTVITLGLVWMVLRLNRALGDGT